MVWYLIKHRDNLSGYSRAYYSLYYIIWLKALPFSVGSLHLLTVLFFKLTAVHF
jgi:hypothetical protein